MMNSRCKLWFKFRFHFNSQHFSTIYLLPDFLLENSVSKFPLYFAQFGTSFLKRIKLESKREDVVLISKTYR